MITADIHTNNGIVRSYRIVSIRLLRRLPRTRRPAGIRFDLASVHGTSALQDVVYNRFLCLASRDWVGRGVALVVRIRRACTQRRGHDRFRRSMFPNTVFGNCR